MRNQLIIFSKNRACQLHLLLESIEKNSKDLFDKIFVIYTYTDKEYFDGYSKLIERFPNIDFIVEVNFFGDTMRIINMGSFEYTTFMVDDNVFYRELPINKEKIFNLFNDQNNPISCFSLRLGLNCNYSHPANLSYTIGNYETVGDFIKINISEQKVDFAYPLSVDGHIFKTNFIKSCLSSVGLFTNPNTLESKLQYLLNRIDKNMCFLKESVLVGIPNNIVNNTHNNRRGLKFYYSEKELNDKYNNSETINLEILDFSNINGPHKEIEYKLKKCY
jgi:hypothetical protein